MTGGKNEKEKRRKREEEKEETVSDWREERMKERKYR